MKRNQLLMTIMILCLALVFSGCATNPAATGNRPGCSAAANSRSARGWNRGGY